MRNRVVFALVVTSLFALALARSESAAGADAPRVTAGSIGVAGGENELAGTLRMLGAHAPLRAVPAANPDDPVNRLGFEAMIRSVLSTQPEDVHTVTPRRPGGEIVGTLEGSFSVDNRGAANYSVTLPLPDSRGYFQPALSVDYGSDGGGGVLGRGFSLSVGSYDCIVRGRTILARDGRVASAVLDDSDHFYLDGKRLVCIAGAYGRPGSVYRTEVDSFVTIQAEGVRDQVRRFVLKASSGRTYTFGATDTADDACQAGFDESRGALGEVPRMFALKRVTDELGDFVEYTYEHVGYGEWVLDHIDYTGGRDVAAPFRVQLHYLACPASPHLYSILERRDHSRLLHDIEVIARAGGQVVSRYTFEYSPAPLQWENRLRAIRAALAADVGAPLKNLPPTTFTWQEAPKDGLAFTPFPAAPGSAPSADYVCDDFDGDGKVDIAEISAGVHVARSTRSGPAAASQPWIDERELRDAGLTAKRRALTGDFNGDRKADLLLIGDDGSTVALVSTGARFRVIRTPDLRPFLARPGRGGKAGATAEPLALSANRIQVEDFNGDGRYDLLVHDRDETLRVFYSNGAAFVAGVETKLGHAATPTRPVLAQSFASDLNGDGLADHAWLERSRDARGMHWALRYAIALPDGGFADAVTLCAWTRRDDPGSAAEPYVATGDFNGDDLPDFAVWNATENDSGWTTFLSRGQPTNRPRLTRDTITRVPSALAASVDIAGHGRVPTAPRFVTNHDRAEGTSARAGAAAVIFTDLNGDGMDDIAWAAVPSGAVPPIWCACLAVGDGTFGAPAALDGAAWATLPSLAAAAGVRADALRLRAVGDINGDGLRDWLVMAAKPDGAEHPVGFGRGGGSLDGGRRPGRLVTGFTNGYGSTTRVGYKPGADDELYRAGPPVAYPIADVRPRGWFVSDRWNDEGDDVAAHFTYRYTGNHVDFSGRGGLGFLAFVTFDRQTGFIKYQFLEHSFPLTGLTKREETYLTWRTKDGVALKLVSAKDHTNAFDLVRDPQTRAPFGTLYPFTAETIESRWLPNRRPDYTSPIEHLGVGPGPIVRALYPTPPVTRTITRKWFDNQATAATAAIRWGDLALPNPFIASPAPRRGRGPTGEDVARHAEVLPSAITYGLNTGTETLATGADGVRVIKTYFEPRPGSSAAPRLHSSTELRGHDDAWEPDGESDTYEYAGSTAFVEDKEVETWDAARGTRTEVNKTHYDRDARGRVLRRTETIEKYGGADPQITTTVKYEASGYTAALDRPARETTPEWTRSDLRHNALFRELASAHYGNGVTASFAYDGLGRSVLTTNDAGYRSAVEYAWTTLSGYDWNLRQRITPPPGSHGVVGWSVYAVRSSETGEATETKYYDRAQRVVRVSTQNAKGESTWVDTVYDEGNQIVAVSAPYPPGAAKIAWTVKSYDGYGITTAEKKVETPGPTVRPISAFDYVLVGTTAEDNGKTADAIAAYMKAVELEPRHSRAWLSLAVLRRDQDDVGGAIRDASRAIESDPEYPSALTFRARCRIDQDQFDDASADLAKSLAIAPDRVSTWEELGRLHFHEHDYGAAIAAYSRVLELDEDDNGAWLMRGLAKLRADEIQPAREDLDHLLKRDAKDEDGWYWRGCVRLASGDESGAVADFAQAIELDPKDAANYSGRANALVAAGKFEAALADYDRALAIGPADEYPYAQFGSYLARRRLHRPAANAPLKHLATVAGLGKWTKSVAAFLAGDEDEQQLLAAAKVEPPRLQCEAYYYSGVLKLLAGDDAGARKRFAQAAALNAPSALEHALSVAELKRMAAAETSKAP